MCRFRFIIVVSLLVYTLLSTVCKYVHWTKIDSLESDSCYTEQVHPDALKKYLFFRFDKLLSYLTLGLVLKRKVLGVVS